MKNFVFVAALLIATSSLLAQDQAATTGKTGQEQSAGQSTSAKARGDAKDNQLTGCLSDASGGTGFVLTNEDHKSGVAVNPGTGVDLKPHVGHEVRLTGNWDKASNPQTHAFNVSAMQHISANCAAASGESKSPANR